MSEFICFLITFAQIDSEWGNSLLKVAVKIRRDQVPGADEYPREYEQQIRELLPLHVRNIGPIVDIETIFDVEVVAKQEVPHGEG